MSLLSSLILRKQSDRILFLMTGRDSREKDFQHFITSIAVYKRLHVTQLNPLSKKDIQQYVEAAGLNIPTDANLINKLQLETEGNLFLLNECLNSLKTTGSLDKLTIIMHHLFKANYLP